MEDFWRIQSQIAQVLHEDVNSTGGHALWHSVD
jgi:hypothetical protein